MRNLIVWLFIKIDNSFVGRFIDRQMNIIEKTNPDSIDVRLIAQFYHIPNCVARFFCEMAVRDGGFCKIETTLPDGKKQIFYKLSKRVSNEQ